MYFFRERSSFIFRLKNNVLFSGKRNIIFLDDKRKITFQCDFFGKIIFSEHLEKENMVFGAALPHHADIKPDRKITKTCIVFDASTKK